MRALTISLAVLLLSAVAIPAQQVTIRQTTIQQTSWASGKEMYRTYCSVCHGNNGDGHGLVASTYKVPVADLTTLANRNGGKFPYDNFDLVMRFGTKTAAHGSQPDSVSSFKDMPVWEPLFRSLPDENEAITQQRIYNLAHYVAALSK